MLDEIEWSARIDADVSWGAAETARLHARIREVAALTSADRTRMYRIYAAHYDATSRRRFESDLDAKNLVITVQSADGAIQGFTTLLVIEAGPGADGEPIRAIYSGDTIIDRAYWGSQVLAFTWIQLAGAIKRAAPSMPLYWFLIVKGHRTFRYLSAFSRVFYPHWSAETPPSTRALMDRLAEARFPGCYQPERGIVHFPDSHGHLKPELAEITALEAARADVAFFLAKNPDYRHGDELVCLTELTADNLRPLARKQFLEGFAA